MAQDRTDEPRETTTDTGTQPMADPLTPTAGLPQTVTATTPQADLASPPRPSPAQAPAPSNPRPAPAPAPAQAPPQARVQPPAQPAQPPAQAPDPYQAIPYPEPTGWPSRGRMIAILAVCALVGSGLGVAAQQLTKDDAPAKVVAKPTVTAAPTPVTITNVSNFDPKGDGFRKQNGTWRSSRYNTADFGGLKDGIGLLLDLGTTRPLRTVTLTVLEDQVTLELRAADAKASSETGYQKVGSPVTAKGAVTLPATAGGSHRYWLVWVTGLGSSNRAVIQDSVKALG